MEHEDRPDIRTVAKPIQQQRYAKRDLSNVDIDRALRHPARQAIPKSKTCRFQEAEYAACLSEPRLSMPRRMFIALPAKDVTPFVRAAEKNAASSAPATNR